MRKISTMLDSIAASLEAKGFIKEAYEIDKIADMIDLQDEVLDIISKAIDSWREAYKGIYDLEVSYIKSAFIKANKKITEMIPDKNKRDKLIEEAILASLDPSDYGNSLRALSQLKYIFGVNSKLIDFPSLFKKIKSMR